MAAAAAARTGEMSTMATAEKAMSNKRLRPSSQGSDGALSMDMPAWEPMLVGAIRMRLWSKTLYMCCTGIPWVLEASTMAITWSK